jgi:hypothetical protein
VHQSQLRRSNLLKELKELAGLTEEEQYSPQSAKGRKIDHRERPSEALDEMRMGTDVGQARVLASRREIPARNHGTADLMTTIQRSVYRDYRCEHRSGMDPLCWVSSFISRTYPFTLNLHTSLFSSVSSSVSHLWCLTLTRHREAGQIHMLT